MRNRDKWSPSKFVYRKGKLIASRNPKVVGAGSRLNADTIAAFYDTYIPLYARGKLIDLGCGRVPLFEVYRDHVDQNICVDWENTIHHSECLDYECDITEALPFDDGEFDTVILSDVLEHIPQPEKLWKEISRISAPKGRVLLNVPFCYWLHEEPHDFYRYTEYALRRFAELAGFRILLLKPAGGTPEVLADILAKHFQTVPLVGRTIAIVIQLITAAFVRTTLGKKLSEKTGKKFPLGYFLIAEKN